MTRSCGCFSAERKHEINRVHGDNPKSGRTKEYCCWINMKTRCLNPKATGYDDYGGRGIKICARWLSSYVNFLSDMGRCPAGCSLDRIDNDGNYTPENCRWHTSRAQASNTRKARFIEFNGASKTISEWARATGIARLTIKNRLDNLGWPVERALVVSPDDYHKS